MDKIEQRKTAIKDAIRNMNEFANNIRKMSFIYPKAARSLMDFHDKCEEVTRITEKKGRIE